MRSRPALPWIAWLIAAPAALSCSSDRVDSRAMAEALAEEFTDGIEFEDGVIMSGEPDQTMSPDPQLYGVTAPHAIASADTGLTERADYGAWFDVTLQASADLTGVVVGGVAHVTQANKSDVAPRHIVIQPAVPNITGTTITFRARVNTFAEAPGNAFIVKMSLLLNDGRISNWHPWVLILFPPTGEPTRIPMCACNNNVSVIDRSACAATPMGPEYLNELDALPCSLWHSLVGLLSADEPLYPDGTWLWPYWLPTEQDRAACVTAITCP